VAWGQGAERWFHCRRLAWLLGGLIADHVLVGCVHIHSCGNGHLWFRPYGDSLWQTPQRKQRSSPQRPAPRLGSAFLRSGIHLGASPPVGFASTSSRCVRLRRTALRAYPQMNASTQPPDGAGRSRSRSRAGELTLGLLSGEKRSVYADPLWELACQRWRPDSRPISFSFPRLIVPYAQQRNAARDAPRSIFAR
jgi:hypothetical protein